MSDVGKLLHRPGAQACAHAAVHGGGRRLHAGLLGLVRHGGRGVVLGAGLHDPHDLPAAVHLERAHGVRRRRSSARRSPRAAGFTAGCRRGLGEYWGFQTGWWWTLSLYVDSAVYIALALGYIQSKWGFSDNWRWLLGIGLVAFFTFINIRGLDLTGKALIVIQVVVMVPFVALRDLGASPRARATRSRPFLPPGETIFSATNLGLAIMMWMYSGYESMSTLAAEVENPQRVIPRAILIAVPIVIATYALTTMAGIRAAGARQLGQHGLRRERRRRGRRLRQGRLDRRRRLPDVAHAGLGHRQQPRPLHRLPGDRLAALVPALARPPLPALHGQGPQALGHALGRHPHHGRGRCHPGQGQLHHADRDRRVPAHVQLHPDLHRGHRAARARARTCRGPTACPCPPGCWRIWVCFPIAIAIYALFTNGSRLPGRRPGRRGQRPDRLPDLQAASTGARPTTPSRARSAWRPSRARRGARSFGLYRTLATDAGASSPASSPSPWPSTSTASPVRPWAAPGRSSASRSAPSGCSPPWASS